MAAFRFRLAPLLRYRTYLREEKRLELGVLQQQQQEIASQIQQLELRLLQQTQQLEEQCGRAVSAVDLSLQGAFARHVAERLREQRQALTLVQEKLAEKRSEVVQADRAVQVLERLRARAWERHQRKEKREEQHVLDEIGQRLSRYAGGG